MNDPTQTAPASAKRINPPGPNGLGEIPGLGPVWACEFFGRYGHNQNTCFHCLKNFSIHLDAQAAA